MASSMMSAAILDIRKDFPGYSSEMYIMSESSFKTMALHAHISHIRVRTRLRSRTIDMGTMLRSVWPTNHVLYHFHRFYRIQRCLLWSKQS